MKNILRNWKTSLFGISTIISGVALIVKGSVDEGVTAVLAGIAGLFAKDSDISGKL